MSQTTTYTAIRCTIPDSLSPSQKVHLVASLSRYCERFPGRIISNPDNTFVLTDLDGRNIGGFTHILECSGCVYSMRLISRAFFDKLFGDDFAAVG